MSTNLWGNLGNISVPRTPLSILKEQAKILTQETSGLLEGRVFSSTVQYEDRFLHTLDIVVPALNDYSYTVAQISHDIDLYPVTVASQSKKAECQDEEEFIDALAAVLTSSKTKTVIA